MRFCWAQYAFWGMIAALGIMAMLSGCGAKGDLFLPSEQKQQVQGESVTPEPPRPQTPTE